MIDHIDTAAEREWLKGLRNRPLSASDRASLMVTFSVMLDALDAERAQTEKAEAMLDYTQQWYAERIRKIEDVAKREGLWPEIAAILANGTASRQMPDGSFFHDPPTYAQQLNIAKHRAEKAEAERDQALARAAAAAIEMQERAADCVAALYGKEIISALPIDPDAEAALQRVVDETWNEAVEAAAVIAAMHGNPPNTQWANGYAAACRENAADILTLRRGVQP